MLELQFIYSPTSWIALVNSAANLCFPPGLSKSERSRVTKSAQLPSFVETEGLVHVSVSVVVDIFCWSFVNDCLFYNKKKSLSLLL